MQLIHSTLVHTVQAQSCTCGIFWPFTYVQFGRLKLRPAAAAETHVRTLNPGSQEAFWRFTIWLMSSCGSTWAVDLTRELEVAALISLLHVGLRMQISMPASTTPAPVWAPTVPTKFRRLWTTSRGAHVPVGLALSTSRALAAAVSTGSNAEAMIAR